MTSFITNDTFEQLVMHLQQMGDAISVNPLEDAVYQSFIQRFPAKQLTSLTLEQYCIGKGGS